MATDYSYSINLCMSPDELERLEPLLKESGFHNRQQLFRAAINAYAGREILTIREDKRKYKPTPRKITLEPVKETCLNGWIFEGGYVSCSKETIYVHFDNAPDIETRLQLRYYHYVPNGDICEWKANNNLRTLREIFKKFPEKD